MNIISKASMEGKIRVPPSNWALIKSNITLTPERNFTLYYSQGYVIVKGIIGRKKENRKYEIRPDFIFAALYAAFIRRLMCSLLVF